MSISPIASSTKSSNNSADIQNQKLNSSKNTQTQATWNGTENAAEVTKTSETPTVSSAASGSTVETSSQGDTIEISREGMSKAQGMGKPQGTGKPQGNPPPASNAQSMKQSSATASILTDEEDSDSSTNLSQYSEYELSQMLSKGTISRSEYDSELERRGKGTGASKAENSIDKTEDVTE